MTTATIKNQAVKYFIWKSLQGESNDLEPIYIFQNKLTEIGNYLEQRHPQAYRDLLNHLRSEA